MLIASLAFIVALQTPAYPQTFELPDPIITELRSGLAGYLRDSEAARFRGTRGARRGEFADGYDHISHAGRVLCVQINGTNAYGGYIGFQDFVVVIADDGKVYPVERMDRHLKNPFLVDAECGLPAD